MPTREEFLCFLKQKSIGDGTPNLLLSTNPGQYQRHTDTIKFDTTLQRHYTILQAIALDEDELRETKYETLPNEEGEGMNIPGVVKAI
ncbi:unnamed protein product [Brassica oleracea var. botrytis]